MKKCFLIFLTLIFTESISAQYTEIINSKRPGFSESPYGVGTDVYQFETGLYYNHNYNDDYFSVPNTLGGELFFRIGKFIERLEVNVNVAYQGDEIRNPFGDNYNIHGISDLRIGAKYLIYQQEYADKSKEIRSWKKRVAFDKKRFIPSFGVYVGVNPNWISKNYKEDGLSLKGAILMQNDINERLVILANLNADGIASESMFYSYIVTMTYAINMYWSFFVENVGKYQKGFSPEYQLGGGVAYLFSPNLQIDASIRTNIFDDYSYIFASTGVSWRLDYHQDKYILKNTPTKTTKKGKEKKGFFKRLFGKKAK